MKTKQAKPYIIKKLLKQVSIKKVREEKIVKKFSVFLLFMQFSEDEKN